MGLTSGHWSKREGDNRLDARGARVLARQIMADHPDWRVDVIHAAQGLSSVEVTRPNGTKARLLRVSDYRRISGREKTS